MPHQVAKNQNQYQGKKERNYIQQGPNVQYGQILLINKALSRYDIWPGGYCHPYVQEVKPNTEVNMAQGPRANCGQGQE